MKVIVLSAALMVVALGCGNQQSANPPPQASSSAASASAAPTLAVASRLDARWMGVTPNQPQGWEELNRLITADFQQFAFRPVNETESMRGCNGCARWTAELTAYAPGKFDPTNVRTGQPVSVNRDDDGFYRPADESEDAIVSWQYADNAWATARGMTSATGGLDQLLELARALKHAERTPIRLPLSLANLPADMPLAQIDIDTSPVEDEANDYGTSVEFAPCGRTDTGATPHCMVATNSLSVHIWPDDYRTPSGGQEDKVVPVKVGGKDGLYDEATNEASVQVQPGMLVEFALGGLDRVQPAIPEQDVLANVTWPPDPSNEATWMPVSDWAK